MYGSTTCLRERHAGTSRARDGAIAQKPVVTMVGPVAAVVLAHTTEGVAREVRDSVGGATDDV